LIPASINQTKLNLPVSSTYSRVLFTSFGSPSRLGNRTGRNWGFGISGFRTGFLSLDQHKLKFVGCRVRFIALSGMYDVSHSISIQPSRFLAFFHLLDIPLTVKKQFQIFALRENLAVLPSEKPRSVAD
jgi:hypothetical protein